MPSQPTTNLSSLNERSFPPPPFPGEVSPYKTYYSNPQPRLNIPHPLLHPAENDNLQKSIMTSWQESEPSDERKRDMEDLRVLLTDTINETFFPTLMEDGKRRFEVEIVGSSSWGGEVDSLTDVALVIVDRALPRGYDPSQWLLPSSSTTFGSNTQARRSRYRSSTSQEQSLPECYSLKALSDCIESVGMTHTKRHPLPLPLLKFVDPVRKLGCDLQCNDLSGLYNCSYILSYTTLSPYILRPLIYTIKRWYKLISGKDPKLSNRQNKYKLSSYSLSIMCVAYLQHISQLPNLQEDVVAKKYERMEDWSRDGELTWGEWGRTQGRAAHTAFSKHAKVGWTPRWPEMIAADAVRGFFTHFSQPSTQDTAARSSCIAIDKASDVTGETQVDQPTSKSMTDQDHFSPLTQIISPLNGGIIPRSAPYKDPTYQDIEHTQITYLTMTGYDPSQISVIMQQFRIAKSLEIERLMGKGDEGVQAYGWEGRKLVIQDPFKWGKSQVGDMTEEICDDFFEFYDCDVVVKRGY
uniref:Poly(A) RNA polymerase mitochondrial-like central palm domain-containing protein n=1 Tax=Kwoniella bestiolae CBS 10118 TaxID=1296100 RepID=A0A1B9G975_9TREE|nr:hypothetical protein I302_02383 [Kwoniella bestiolae CBS 10118]OCF27541.1 hypothetical protein I302_02383 [Kwoniella bestiolae CBS 10118]